MLSKWQSLSSSHLRSCDEIEEMHARPVQRWLSPSPVFVALRHCYIVRYGARLAKLLLINHNLNTDNIFCREHDSDDSVDACENSFPDTLSHKDFRQMLDTGPMQVFPHFMSRMVVILCHVSPRSIQTLSCWHCTGSPVMTRSSKLCSTQTDVHRRDCLLS